MSRLKYCATKNKNQALYLREHLLSSNHVIHLDVCVTKWHKSEVAGAARDMFLTLAEGRSMFLELADKGRHTVGRLRRIRGDKSIKRDMNVRWAAEVYTANLFRAASSGFPIQINGRGDLGWISGFRSAELMRFHRD